MTNVSSSYQNPRPLSSIMESALANDAMFHWQQKQIAKCISENTVNFVIESYGRFPDDTLTDGQIGFEHSAISMAINNHGLQRTISTVLETEASHSTASSSDVQLTTMDSCSAGTSSSTSSSVEQEHAAIVDLPLPLNHLDFMETAVAVAIQKKGLYPTTF